MRGACGVRNGLLGPAAGQVRSGTGSARSGESGRESGRVKPGQTAGRRLAAPCRLGKDQGVTGQAARSSRMCGSARGLPQNHVLGGPGDRSSTDAAAAFAAYLERADTAARVDQLDPVTHDY